MRSELIAASSVRLVAVAVAMLVASFASAEVTRVTVRSGDILLALIEAEVPVASWGSVDGPYEVYRSEVDRELAAWQAQPSLDRMMQRPADVAVRIAEQRRRGMWLLTQQRRLRDSLRFALVDAAVAPEVAEMFGLWLDARMGDRAVGPFDWGDPYPLPATVIPGLDGATESTLRTALRPQLAAYATAAEEYFETALSRPVGATPRDEEGDSPLEFRDAIGAAVTTRRAADRERRLKLSEVSAAAHQAVLASIPERAPDPASEVDAARVAARRRLARALFVELDYNAQDLLQTRLLAGLARHVQGVSVEEKKVLASAADRAEAAIAAYIDAMLATATPRPDQLRALRGTGDQFQRRRSIEQELDQALRGVLGDRMGMLLAVTNGMQRNERSAEEIAIELCGPSAAAILDELDGGDASVRLMRGDLRVPSRWRSLSEVEAISSHLRARSAELAGGDDGIRAAIEQIFDDHEATWNDSIVPLQNAAAGHVRQLEPSVPSSVDPPRIKADFASLTAAIDEAERTLEDGVRALARAPIDAERWRLDRSIELFASPRGTDTTLWAPLLPIPLTIEEVLRGASISEADRKVAEGVAYSQADALVAAMERRQAGLERLRIALLWRGQALEAARETGRWKETVEEFRGLLRDLDANPGRDDLVVVEAWEAIHEIWSAALPDAAQRLRESWLRLLVPELQHSRVPIGRVLERVAGQQSEEAVRVAVQAVATAHAADRDRLVLHTAEAVRLMPRSMEWLDRTHESVTDPRLVLRDAFQQADLDLSARALRDTLAITGLGQLDQSPGLRVSVLRLVDRSPMADQ